MSTNLIAVGQRRTQAPWRPAALRAAIVAMAAVLAAYGSAIWIEHRAHLHIDVVITAVAVTMTSARIHLGAGARDRLIGVAVIAVSAMGASEVSSLISRHQVLGDAAFTVALSGSIWIRRFGPGATKAGSALVIPFIALLVTHTDGVPPHAADYDLWSALIAVVAGFWVTVFQLGAAALGFSEQRVRATPPGVAASPTSRPASKPGSGSGSKARSKRIPASTRMAGQMAVALGGAFAVGHAAFHEHWPWAVLTAFIVGSGARGRGDVLHKGVLRASGAAAGTVVATAIAGAFPPGDRWSIVFMFTAIALASWLREISYAFWAASVTAVLSLLYGYFGQSADSLLVTRLEAILVGAAVGIAASWFIMPVRTGDVLKRRLALALAALNDFLATPMGNRAEVRRREARFLHAVAQLEQIAKPLRARRRLTGAGQQAATIDAIHDCVEPVATLAEVFAATRAGSGPDWLPRSAADSAVTALNTALGTLGQAVGVQVRSGASRRIASSTSTADGAAI